jgi:hypothetical protein
VRRGGAGASIHADVNTRRRRAERTAFWREKDMSIFFVSKAHHFPEHASQAVSRGSEAALISLEKRAPLGSAIETKQP